MTPYYSRDGIVIYHADARELLATIPAGSVDAVVTDPPYGLSLGSGNNQCRDSSHLHKEGYDNFSDSYDEFVNDIIPRINAAIDISGRAAVFTGPHINEQRKPSAIGGIFVPSATGRTPWGSKQFLPILLYGKPKNYAGCHRPTVFTSTESAPKNGHPCPKPLRWMEWVIGLVSDDVDTILDPFGGSMTTGVAAWNLGRKAILCEISEEYCELGAKRLDRVISQGRLFKPEPVRETQATLFEEQQ